MNLQSSDFELFGLEPRFALDRAALDVRWKQLQREVHPDRYVAQGPAAQRAAMQWSARVNEAYQRLKDPLKRAMVLCALGGAPVQLEGNAGMSVPFLTQQMQWREDLDTANDAPALLDLREQVGQARAELLQRCAGHLDQGVFQEAAQCVRELMFMEKFIRDLELALERFD